MRKKHTEFKYCSYNFLGCPKNSVHRLWLVAKLQFNFNFQSLIPGYSLFWFLSKVSEVTSAMCSLFLGQSFQRIWLTSPLFVKNMEKSKILLFCGHLEMDVKKKKVGCWSLWVISWEEGKNKHWLLSCCCESQGLSADSSSRYWWLQNTKEILQQG